MGDTKTIVETPEDFLEEAIATMTVSALISYENAIAQGRREGRLEGAEAMQKAVTKHLRRMNEQCECDAAFRIKGCHVDDCVWQYADHTAMIVEEHIDPTAVVAGMEASEP